jgi:hypothetical protein
MLLDSIFSFSGTAPENNLLLFDINSIKINKNQSGVNVSNKNLP